MSDDEFHEIPDDDDEDEDYVDYDMDEDDDDPPIVAAPRRAASPPGVAGVAALMQQAQDAARRQGPQQFFHPGAFQAGFGGHAFARAPAGAFRRQYMAFSTAILESAQGRSDVHGLRANLMYGGKIVLPPSALEEITQLDIELPMDLELRNPLFPDVRTHAGILEFIADEGAVHLPQWMMDQLQLNEGDPIRIWGTRLPKGKLVKIQAQSVDFLEVSDPKAVLENALRHFSCVSPGDIIEISYNMLLFRFKILEITPSDAGGINLIDTDLEVDFETPLGYVEPERPAPKQAPTMKDKWKIDTSRTDEVDGQGRGSGSNTPAPPRAGSSLGGGAGREEGKVAPWEAFKSTGNTLAGKRIKGKGIKARAPEEVDKESKILRTDKPRVITADTQIGGRQVPAALTLPYGSLFFGFENLKPPPGSAAEAEATAKENKPSSGGGGWDTVSGTGNTLRAAARSSAPASSSSSAKGGKSGKKPDVVLID